MNISESGEYLLTGEGDHPTNKYSELYQFINDNLAKYNDIYGYYDVIVICARHGHVMYSNAREADLGTNLSVGPYKDSGLGKLWNKVITDKTTAIVDLEPYAPSGGTPAMFIGSPVYDNGTMTAVVALQVNLGKINAILSQTSGMGETGKVYWGGEDFFMETESKFTEKGGTAVLEQLIDSPASKVLGQSSEAAMTDIFVDYRGKEVLSVFSHANIDKIINAGFDWAVIAEVDRQEILKPVFALIRVIVIIAVVIIAAAVVIMAFMSRSLSIPIRGAAEAAQQIAAGDLTVKIRKDFLLRKDEIGQLAHTLEGMIENLTDVVRSVASGSEQIASASEQLAEGNQDLSNRTEQQASALEETSSAIEEMNASIKSNADNTATADQLSREAVIKTEEGTKAVSRVVTAMTEISESSNRIADIIEVINNIAFQTNLLALNASIEAARAGEQGKGFAVVAVEVRKLAKRSDKAAGEITAIIKNSNLKVEEGVEIASDAGEVLNEINAAVKRVTALVSEISAASREQLSSVDQIDQTLSSLDDNTQKNAALVEEAASSTEELSAQAQELNSTMQFFKLDFQGGEKGDASRGHRHLSERNHLGKPEEQEKTF